MAPDLERVLQHTGLTAEELIAAHSGQTVASVCSWVRPGLCLFRLITRRTQSPRASMRPAPHVPAGSVGIAERQSAVYPQRLHRAVGHIIGRQSGTMV